MTAALEGDEWSAARPGRTLSRERPGTHFTGGWVDHRAGLDERKILVPIGIQSRTVQPIAQLLYRLSYPPGPPIASNKVQYLTMLQQHSH